MSANAIINSYYTATWLTDALSKMHPEDLREDLKQEVFLVVLEKGQDWIIDAHEKGFLKWFIVRVMLNLIKSDSSKFWHMFRNFVPTDGHEKLFSGFFDPDEEQPPEPPELNLDEVFGTTREGLYERDMLYHYVFTFNSNALRLSQATKIPYKTVTRTLQIAKERCKNYLMQQQPPQPQST